MSWRTQWFRGGVCTVWHHPNGGGWHEEFHVFKIILGKWIVYTLDFELWKFGVHAFWLKMDAWSKNRDHSQQPRGKHINYYWVYDMTYVDLRGPVHNNRESRFPPPRETRRFFHARIVWAFTSNAIRRIPSCGPNWMVVVIPKSVETQIGFWWLGQIGC